MPKGHGQPRGAGAHTSPAKIAAFLTAAFEQRVSIRQACRIAGIAKDTGRGIYWDERTRRRAA